MCVESELGIVGNTLLEGWVGGWMDGWMEAKAGLRIAYSNQQGFNQGTSTLTLPFTDI